MFNYLRLSYNLLRLANSVLDRRKEKFKKELEGLDLSERVLNESLDCLIGIKDHLVRKMCIHWLKKKSIILPEDLPKVEIAKDLAKRNRGIDYMAFDSPVEIIDKYTKIEGIKKSEYIHPDSVKELYNKVNLGDGVTVYTVEDTKAGQYAVRKLADSHFGPKFDGWCITGRYPNLFPDKERDDMGMILESFDRWKNEYSAYPKRLAFKDGRFFAFCASNKQEIVWWDQGDHPFTYIPNHKHLDDDQNFIDKYIHEKGDHFETDIKKMGQLDAKRILKSDKATDELKLKAIRFIKIEDRISFAKNPNTPKDVLVKLSEDEGSWVRARVAENPNTPSEVLVKLSSDEKYTVRSSVAENPNTPAEALVKLSNDENNIVRSYIAENPNTKEDTLVKLSNDEKHNVRFYVVKNPNTPIDVLVKMSNDESRGIREMIAKNPSTPVDVLVKLSEDKDNYVRSGVAGNPNTPVDILVKLSSDDSYRIRSSVAQNPNTPIEILVKISKDSVETVRNIAIKKLRSRGIDV